MVSKRVQSVTYADYVATLKEVVAAKTPDEFPRLIVVTGSSPYLLFKTGQAILAAWNKFGVGTAQCVEAAELQQSEFQSLWSQVSLFEPKSLYLLRRAGALRSLPSWLSAIKSFQSLKSNLVLDCGEKIAADLSKQINRLQGVTINCVEPHGLVEFVKITQVLCKRAGIELEDNALRLILDSTGYDLGKIENEINKLALQFAGRTAPLARTEISSSIGVLREDDVFELFELLRKKNSFTAHLLAEHFLDRGESAIALTGIFARFAREQVERGNLKKGLMGLKACAIADRRLKSSRIDESLILSNVIEAMGEGLDA